MFWMGFCLFPEKLRGTTKALKIIRKRAALVSVFFFFFFFAFYEDRHIFI